MSIYGKIPLKIFPQGTSRPISTKLGLKHRRLNLIIFCSNDNPELALTYFTTMSINATYAFIWENVTMIDSLEMNAFCDQEVGLYRKLNN